MPFFEKIELENWVRKMHDEKGARPVLKDFEYKFGAPKKHDFDYYGGFAKVLEDMGYPHIEGMYDVGRLIEDFRRLFEKTHGRNSLEWPNCATIDKDDDCAPLRIYQKVLKDYTGSTKSVDILDFLYGAIGAPERPLPWSKRPTEDYIKAVSDWVDQKGEYPLRIDYDRNVNLPNAQEVAKRFKGGIYELREVTIKRRKENGKLTLKESLRYAEVLS